MLRSVFGRFRTVFKRTVTTPSVNTSRYITRRPRPLLFAVGFVGGVIFVTLGQAVARIHEIYEQAIATPPTRPMFTWQAANNVAGLVKETCPAVVHIEGVNDSEEWCGSGFFINKEGLILTNAHVAKEHNKTVTILTTDDREYQGVVESLDRKIDLALVRIQADTTTKEFPIIKLGDSSKMRPNDFVMAIGSPMGNRNCFMTGVILNGSGSSDIHRYQLNDVLCVMLCLFLFGRNKVIRSNIISYGGASGSPIINQNGEAVGVLFASGHNYDEGRPDRCLYSTTLAVPSNTVKKFLAKAKIRELEWV